jgi:hypothetical protein
MQMWNGEEVVEIAWDLAHSPHFLQPTAPLERHDGAGQDSDSFEDLGRRQTAEEDEEDEEDVYKNWRPPNKDTDFAAHAGQAEKKVLQRLNFDLRLNGRAREIGSGNPPHGLDAKGYLTQDTLRHLGIGNYTRLWRRSGTVVEELAWPKAKPPRVRPERSLGTQTGLGRGRQNERDLAMVEDPPIDLEEVVVGIRSLGSIPRPVGKPREDGPSSL